jgi:hypothetical protein
MRDLGCHGSDERPPSQQQGTSYCTRLSSDTSSTAAYDHSHHNQSPLVASHVIRAQKASRSHSTLPDDR